MAYSKVDEHCHISLMKKKKKWDDGVLFEFNLVFHNYITYLLRNNIASN